MIAHFLDPASALGGSPSKEETEQKRIDSINKGKELDLQLEMVRMVNNMMPVMNSLAPLMTSLADYRRERDVERDLERRMRRRLEDTDWIERDMEG